jgi:hypothetical protein
MDAGEQSTGTRDEHYNLISVLYHALHGAETIEAYILDAEAAGDERLASFFREAQAMQRQLAERAKGMLGILEEAGPETGVPPGTAPGRTTRKVPPDAALQAPPRDVRRGLRQRTYRGQETSRRARAILRRPTFHRIPRPKLRHPAGSDHRGKILPYNPGSGSPANHASGGVRA